MAFSNSQYNSIMRDYERIRSRQRANYEKRIETVYKTIPQMRELNESPSRLAFSKYKEYRKNGDKSILSSLSTDIEDIKIKKQTLLRKYGFPDDYMEMQYECEDCKDTGMTATGRCHCFNKKLIDILYSGSNIKSILDTENFENFKFEYFDDEKIISNIGLTARAYMEKIYDICKKFVANFDKEKGNILFTGNTGVGKSFLSNCIAKDLLDSYHSVIYLTSMQLFDYLEKTKLNKDILDDESQLVADYIDTCDLLIIDDLGTETNNTWTSSQLFRILNNRLNSNKSTIISTNLSINAIRDMYSERVSSRIRSLYKLIALYGDDIRIKNRIFGGKNVKSN